MRQEPATANWPAPRTACVTASAIVLSLLISMVLLAGCASFPTPKGPEESLLVLLQRAGASGGAPSGSSITLYFYGAEDFTIELIPNSSRVVTKVLPPGEYEFAYYEEFFNGQYRGQKPIENVVFELAEQSVYLFPFALLYTAAWNRSVVDPLEMTQREQEIALGYLERELGFESWIDRKFVGFGNVMPERVIDPRYHNVRIESPLRSNVSIDGVAAGETPVTTQLKQGKYLIEVFRDYYEPKRLWLDVDADTDFEVVLKRFRPADETDIGPIEMYKRVPPLVVLIRCRVENENAISGELLTERLFESINAPSQPFEAVLLASKSNWLGYARRVGASYVIECDSTETGGEKIVSGLVTEVRTGIVLDGFFYVGRRNDDDDATLLFAIEEALRAIHRARGAAEKSMNSRSENDEVEGYWRNVERVAATDDIVLQRFQRRRAFGVDTLYGSVGESFPVAENRVLDRGSSWGVGVAPAISFQYAIARPLAFDIRFVPWIRNGWSINQPLLLDLSFYAGPQLTLRGYRSDVCFSVLGKAAYANGATYEFFEEGIAESYSLDPGYLLGALLDMNVKYYLQRSVTSVPRYVRLGVMFDLVEYRYDTEFSLSGPPAFEVWLYLGVGRQR